MTQEKRKSQSDFGITGRMRPGSNVEQTAGGSDCRVFRLYDETGDGIMTLYEVFRGVYLMFNDFHLSQCRSEFQSTDSLFCIDHCREGAMEQRFIDGKVFRIKDGNLKFDRRSHHRGPAVFPNCHYHGITISFESAIAQDSINEFAPGMHISIDEIAAKFCPDDIARIYDEDDILQSVFHSLYYWHGLLDMDFLKVKIFEILIYLKNWKPSAGQSEDEYIMADQAAKIRAIHEYLTDNISRSVTQRELASQFGISESAMKKGFRRLYGESIHAYVKAYRIQQAAAYLENSPDMTISRIARMIGYTSHSKFTAAFRAQFGMTPQEYRTQKRK